MGISGGEWLFQASRRSPRATGSTQSSPVVARHVAISFPPPQSWREPGSTQFSPPVGLPNAWPGDPDVRGANGGPNHFSPVVPLPQLSSHTHLVFLFFSGPPSIPPTRTFAATRLPVTFRLRATLCSVHQSPRPRRPPFGAAGCCSSRVFHAPNHSLKQPAAAVARPPGRPSVPRRLTNGPPPGRPSHVRSQVRRFAAAHCSPSRTYHRVATRVARGGRCLAQSRWARGLKKSAEHVRRGHL